MSMIERAWLAGLLDGEGCFDAPHGNPRIRVKMSDFDVVLRAATLLGARTHEERVFHDRKPLLVAQITGAPAAAIMRDLLPLMGSRRSAKITNIVLAHEARTRAPRSVSVLAFGHPKPVFEVAA